MPKLHWPRGDSEEGTVAMKKAPLTQNQEESETTTLSRLPKWAQTILGFLKDLESRG